MTLPLFAVEEDGRPTIALVLSGGGVRGLAHVPIIAELEERGIIPDYVIGTSMGGLIGGLYAAGYNAEELYDFVLAQDFLSLVFRISQEEDETERAYNHYYDTNLSLHFSSEGFGSRDSFLDDSAINLLLHKVICRVDNISDFDSLPIAFRTVGTNYKTGEGIIFSSGSLYEALRATMSMPVIFPTVILDDGTYVVDGGIYDNFPVELARELGADIVIAVDVNEAFLLGSAQDGRIDTLSGSFTQYMNIAMRKISSESYDEVDYLFIPDTSALGPLDFAQSSDAIQAGLDCVAENEALFDALEAELAPWLPLEKSKAYTDIDYPIIKGVVFSGNFASFSQSFSEDFSGLEYNEESVEALDRKLSMLKRLYGLQNVTYKMVDGYIRVSTREYVNMASSLRLGLSGGAAAFYDIADGTGRAVLNPDFSISIELEKNNFRFIPAIKFGQYNLLSLNTFLTISQNFGIGLELYGGFGGMSAISHRLYRYRYATRDWNFGAALDLAFSAGFSHRFDILVGYDYYLLGNMENSKHTNDVGNTVIWEKRKQHVPSLTLSYHLDHSRLENINETGYDLRLEGSLGWDDYFYYSLRGDFSLTLRLDDGGRFFLDTSLSVFTSRGPYELLSSYTVDSFGQLSRDCIYISASFKYYFFSNGFYSTFGAFAEALNGDDITIPETSLDMTPFVLLDRIEAGLVLGVGYLSDFGDFNLSLHLSYTGNISIAFAIK